MRTLRYIWNALRAGSVRREIDEELSAHFDMIEAEERRQGADAGEAHRTARVRFGNRTAYTERTRDADIAFWLDSFLHDVRFAVRQLRRNPTFTAIAISLLALGIGLNTAIFTVMNSVVLRALPLPDADRMVILMESEPGGCCSPPSWLDQRDIRQRTHSFESIAAYSFDDNFLFRVGNRSMRLLGGYVTSDYFGTLSVRPVLGRTFTANEEQHATDVVLLREDFWRTQLNGDRNILSKTVVINGKPCNVIGILPSWFRFPADRAVIWAPLVPEPAAVANRGWHGFPLLGRMKRGVTLQQARADLDSVIRQLAREYPEKDGDRTGALFTLRYWKIGDEVTARLVVLQIAALALFVMACGNVSSLLLARDSIRSREFAIRAALGASRARQIGQHVTESMLLTAFASVTACLVAWAATRLLIRLCANFLPRIEEVSPDWKIVAGMLGLALLATLALGLTTAIQSTARDVRAGVQETARGTATRHGLLTRKALVVLQVTCAVALLGGAGELFESMWNLLHQKVGIDTNHVLAIHLTIPLSRYSSGSAIARFYDEAVSRIGSVAGVEDAAAINLMPVEEMGYNGDVVVQGLPPHSNSFFAEYRWIAGDYFRTLHIPILRGRFFVPEETHGKRPAVIINQAMARALWGNRDPLGARIATETPEFATVVGVVGDVRQSGLAVPPRPELFYPARLYGTALPSWSLLLRTALPESEIVPVVHRELAKLDPDAVLYEARSMNQVITDSVSYQRLVSLLVLCFSLLAIVLAALGIYGVVSYVVEQRAPEFAIRATVGARPQTLAALVARQGLTMVLAGILLGALCVIPLNVALAHYLFDVHRLDAPVFASVLLLLLLSGAAATFIPAVRAAALDPMRLLRQQ